MTQLLCSKTGTNTGLEAQSWASFSFFHVLTFYFISYWCVVSWGFPDGAVVKNPPAKQETQEMQLQALGGEDPLEEEMAAHSSILP